jgi:hypothetical protein
MKKPTIIILFFIVNLMNAQVGIGTITPGNTLEINSGTAGASGLRFTQLNSGSATVSNIPAKVLGLNATGDAVLTELYPIVVSASTTLDVNTPTNTTLTLGELEFRTDKVASGNTGDLQVRSSSASTVAVTVFGHEEHSTNAAGYIATTATLNNNAGAYITFAVGGANSNDLLVYRIVTAGGGLYRIRIVNRGDINIFITGEKLK